MKKIYAQIAKQRGTSAAEVEHEIQVAIDEAYKNPNVGELAIPRAGDKPTPEEFIAHIVNVMEDKANY